MPDPITHPSPGDRIVAADGTERQVVRVDLDDPTSALGTVWARVLNGGHALVDAVKAYPRGWWIEAHQSARAVIPAP